MVNSVNSVDNKYNLTSKLSALKALLALSMGLWSIPVLRVEGIMHEERVSVHLCRLRATENEVGWFLLLEWWCDSLFKSVLRSPYTRL